MCELLRYWNVIKLQKPILDQAALDLSSRMFSFTV